ncbi:MAG: YhgE/Pip domain-containing protein [Bifidobacterium sp.]|uniref:YhgE/Pip domain-containing protein n=1 Tax=Bifidobacterium fermentum TaxID=3059035 RepID=A0AB39UIQ2_9BIFI
MRTAFHIYRRDIFRLLRNPIALIITIGVCLIPSLYAWFNIAANWDPYSNTKNLKVAVANEDTGAHSDSFGTVDIGKQVVASLHRNKELGWQFVDEGDAINGVKSGEYYAAIVLPKNFSANVIGSVEGTSSQSVLQYYVNEKKNAVAPKITDTGASSIDKTINSMFVSTVSDVVASRLSAAAGNLDSSASKTRAAVVSNLNSTINDIQGLRANLRNMQGTIGTAQSTVQAAEKTSAGLSSQMASAQKALAQSQKTLSAARSSSLTFSHTLIGALNSGSTALSGITVDVNLASSSILDGFNTADETVNTVNDRLTGVLDANDDALDDLQSALKNSGLDPDGQAYQGIDAQISALQGINTQQRKQLSTFNTSTSSFIDAGKSATGSMSSAVSNSANSGISTLNSAGNTLSTTTLPGLLNGLDSFSGAAGTLSGTVTSLQTTVEQTVSLLKELDGTLADARSSIGTTEQSLASVQTQLASVRTDVAALGSSAVWKQVSKVMHLDKAGIAQFMQSPVNLSTTTVYPIANYGSSVAPFYTNLALWVGGFIIIAIFKLEVDREGLSHITTTASYLGRGLLVSTLGILQALFVTIGDLVIGIQCPYPWLFVMAGMLASFVYVNIIYALATVLRHIGKAVGVILLILQIPGSSGMYPIELMPEFFRRLNPWLPFTYGINAMRETIGGMYGTHYWWYLLSLSYYIPIALFLGLFVRQYLLNLNVMFDNRLAVADLFITEQSSLTNRGLSLASMMSVFAGSKEFEHDVRNRARRFFRGYPMMIRTGLILVVVLPIVFLVLLFSVEAKIMMLNLWIVSIILIDFYLIMVEYMRDSYARQLGVTVGQPFNSEKADRPDVHSGVSAVRDSDVSGSSSESSGEVTQEL